MTESATSFEELYDRIVDVIKARRGQYPTAELKDRLGHLYGRFYPWLGTREDIVNSLREVLTYLTTPEGRTDANCWVTDYFVDDLFDVVDYEIPDGDVFDVLRDIILTLHDTVSAPRIAENFGSTPEQLLEKLQALSN